MTAISVSYARQNLFSLVRRVNEDHVVVEIVARSGGNAVLMSAEDYESLQERLDMFFTRANARTVRPLWAGAEGWAARELRKQAVRVADPFAEQHAAVPRIDQVLDAKVLGGTEG